MARSGPVSSKRARRMRIVALSLLMIAGCVNFLDRSAVAIGNNEIRETFGLGRAEMGILLSSFAWAYGLPSARNNGADCESA